MKSLSKSMVVFVLGFPFFFSPVHGAEKTPPKPDTAVVKAPEATPAVPQAAELFWIGIRVAPVPSVLLPQFGVMEDGPGRIFVEQVIADAPAAKAGLKRGDVILTFGGEEINELPDLIDQIAKAKATAQPLVVMREGKSTDLKVTPEQRPAEPVFSEEEITIDDLPGVRLDATFPGNFRDPKRTMRQMENAFRQMQGGTDDGKTVIDEDTVTETDDLAKGEGQRIEVRSHTGPDGKTQIHVTKSMTTNGKTQKKSWIVESIEKLPDEIRNDVKALFGR